MRRTTMAAPRSPDTDERNALRERAERGLTQAPPAVVARRLNLTAEELRDLCPDLVDDDAPADDRSAVSGY